MMDLTSTHLRKLLNYDPQTGIFTRRVGTNWRSPVGAVAGSPNKDGYLQIRVEGEKQYAHRLAWLYMTGAWPALEIDHRNGVRDDNRWTNLREVTDAGNRANQRRPRRDNQRGALGVTRPRTQGKCTASIKVDGKPRHLGTFESVSAASAAYWAARGEHTPL